MNRRDILKSMSALVAVSTAGLAGCIGGDGGGSGGGSGESRSCDVPGGNLKDYFPDSDDYTLQDPIRVIEQSSIEGQEREADAFYNGPNGEMVFQITQYSSETVAAEETTTVSEQGSGYAGSVGYIQTGTYIISAIGADKSTVKDIMKATPLGDGCVDDNVEFA
jgi:hypothetical protein